MGYHPLINSSPSCYFVTDVYVSSCVSIVLYCSHTIPQQQYSKILQQRTHQPHSQLNLWHDESFSRFTKVCVTALCILITDHTFNLFLLHVLFRGPCHVSLWTTSLVNKGLFRSSCKHEQGAKIFLMNVTYWWNIHSHVCLWFMILTISYAI